MTSKEKIYTTSQEVVFICIGILTILSLASLLIEYFPDKVDSYVADLPNNTEAKDRTLTNK